MAGHEDGESFYDDDDLDALPDDALVELENNAIQFTQAQTQARLKAPPSSDYGDDFGDEDLEDVVVIDESRSTPVVAQSFNPRYNTGPTPREQFRQQRYGPVSRLNGHQVVRTQANDSGFHEPLGIPSRAPLSERLSQPQGSGNAVQPGKLPTDHNEERRRIQEELEEVILLIIIVTTQN